MAKKKQVLTLSMVVFFSLIAAGCNTKSPSKPTSSSNSISNESSLPQSSVASSSVVESSKESSSSELQSSSIVQSSSSEIPVGPQIGDVIKKWSSEVDYPGIPLDTPSNYEGGRGYKEIIAHGREDNESLSYDLYCGDYHKGYIANNIASYPYFNKRDVKNGYIISLYTYVMPGGNVESFRLQAQSTNYADELYGVEVPVGQDGEGIWKRITVSFDSVDDFKGFKLHYTVKDPNKVASFLVDDIEVTIGSPTVTEHKEPANESLYKLYEDDFKVGTCLSSYSLNSSTIKNLTTTHFNSITAENEGKPEHTLDQAACQKLAKTNPAGVAIKTSSFESIYNWAEANHIKVRHHTFVWHNQTPAWFFNEDYQENGKMVSKELMLKRLENYIQVTLDAFNDKWPGLVYAIDVANEAIDYGTVRKNKNKWYDTLGSEYVYYAMKYAHMHKKPWQDLYYNDYSYDFVSNNCSYALNTLLKKAISEKLVDGLGIQGHLITSANMDTIIKDAKMIYEKGLKCQITELDIGINDTTKDSYEKQEASYSSLITKILKAHKNKEANINAIVLWGVSDNYSWRNDEYPLLFDGSFNKKPAYYAFYNAKTSV